MNQVQGRDLFPRSKEQTLNQPSLHVPAALMGQETETGRGKRPFPAPQRKLWSEGWGQGRDGAERKKRSQRDGERRSEHHRGQMTNGDMLSRQPQDSVTKKSQSCALRCSVSLSTPDGFEHLKEGEQEWLCFI